MADLFRVRLRQNSYPIYLGREIDSLGRLCRQHSIPDSVVVLSDANSSRAALPRVVKSLKGSGFRILSLVMPAGEKQKSPARVSAIHSAMLKAQVPRRAALVALGGGVVGDVGGFVASTYKRGLKFVQCPTTLLSQVDSSIGGKNGVNHPRGKNAIGSYLQPAFVLSDISLLDSLPRREIITGIGEILKYPFVGDPSFLGFIENHLDSIIECERRTILAVARRCLRIKTQLVSLDERELMARGRNLLNVGHAIGHAIETLSRYRLHHGEAVFLGIIAEGWISVKRGWLPESQVQRLTDVYRRLGCRFSIKGISTTSILRQILSARQKFVLPRTSANPAVVSDVTAAEIRDGLSLIRAL